MEKYVNIRYDKECGEYWIFNCNEYCAPQDYKSPYSGKVILDLELKKAKLVCITMLAEHIEPDTIVVKNEKGMYAIFNTFRGSMQYGAIYMAMSGGFRYKNVYGFRHKLFKGYLVLQDEFNKWGVVALLHTNDFRDPLLIHEEVVPFIHKDLDNAIKAAGPLFTIDNMLEAYEHHKMHGRMGNLCSPYLEDENDKVFYLNEIGQ